MKETLTATFTNELGEAITYLYSLERMGPALKTAQTIEDFLLFEYAKYWVKRDKSGAIAAGHWLIALEVTFNEPGQCSHLFTDGWDGKFTYDPKLIN